MGLGLGFANPSIARVLIAPRAGVERGLLRLAGEQHDGRVVHRARKQLEVHLRTRWGEGAGKGRGWGVRVRVGASGAGARATAQQPEPTLRDYTTLHLRVVQSVDGRVVLAWCTVAHSKHSQYSTRLVPEHT